MTTSKGQQPGREREIEVGFQIHNSASGTDGSVVQAGVVDGGLHLHLPSPSLAWVVPRQLPAVPWTFTGRAVELAELDRALDYNLDDEHEDLDAPTLMISAIGGAGGIGKTWFAVRWATRRAERFPDGQLFVDLHGFSPTEQPLQPAVAVRGFLDALGVDHSRIPADPEAQAALYRSIVVDRRMLILLDNAASAEQVEPLLPGGGACTVVITSRRTLTSLLVRHNVRHVTLDVLTDVEAHTLLRRRLGKARIAAEPHAVTRLIAFCRGFPLALSILAARAHARPDLQLIELAAELGEQGVEALDDESDPSASLSAVLSASFSALTAGHKQAFGLLGIAPGPDIDLYAAASLTGLSQERVTQVLRALIEASMLHRDANGRYSMHDLVRSFATMSARHHTSSELRHAALRRVVDFYLHTAASANRLTSPHFLNDVQLDAPADGCRPRLLPDLPTALTWLDREHQCLRAARHIASVNGWHQAVWQFAGFLDDFHFRRGHRQDRLVAWQAAMTAAEHLGDPAVQSLVHTLLGDACAALDRHDEAMGHLERGLALAERHGNLAIQSRAHLGICWALSYRGEHRQALVHAARAVELAQEVDDPVRVADAQGELGWNAARLGDFERGRDACQAALVLHRIHDHHDGEAHDLDSLGYIDHHTGRHHEAISHYRQALDRYGELGHHWAASTTLERLGHPHIALGQHHHARAAWQKALDLYREQGRSSDAERVQRQLDELDHVLSV
ncbi:NB-ARC domain-containing protein [Saccharothrix carnea]|uniref:NB-ARC domain-containing protein n=1 Tax=Saccharothrix carnea TaxID=1280637 RepID=A0A2P8I499_SACCR|nr:tetratricopeptide repeat protein [Saccharothrix carnea]PSL53288.1 NB-ARC domain-containing protein [Saccharothrix carnea]